MFKWLKLKMTQKSREIEYLKERVKFWEDLYQEEERCFNERGKNCDLRDKIKKLEAKVKELDPFQ